MIEDYLVVKGDFDKLTYENKKYLIGIEQKAYHFEAIINSEDAEKLSSSFVFEKPEIAQIMRHSIKDRRQKNECN